MVCGPSGSGKSTLIRCINQLEKHEEGRITVDGITHDGKAKSLNAIRQKVGMVFQQFNLFPHLSVLDNLTLGPVRSRGMSRPGGGKTGYAISGKGAYSRTKRQVPKTIVWVVSSKGSQFARSLCMEPQIMLFDEPTSALDPEMINEVLDVMSELASSGMTMIVVTHEMGFARRVADTMVFMDHGEVVEMAPPEKFFDKPDSVRCQDFLQKILQH